TVGASQLPPGLILGPATGVISGNPTQSGAFTPTFQVMDSGGCSASRQLPIGIDPPDATLQITTQSLNTGRVGVAYSQQLTATGGTGTLTWSSASQLPAGITLSASGVLSGTPTASGSFDVAVQVRDSNNATDSRTFPLTINPPLTTLQISTTSLPAGRVG